MNWLTSPIGSVCVPTAQRDPRERPDEVFRYVDISSIDRDQKRILSSAEIIGADAPSRARMEIRAGDVLVSTVRPNLNAVATVPDELDGHIASTGFCVLRPNEPTILGRFLFYYCCTGAFVNGLVTKVRGAQYPAVSDSDIKTVHIPLPLPSEQRRIVEILDQADRLRRLRADADAKAERILPALFVKMFGDPTKNPMGWELRPLGQLAAHITSGSRGWSMYMGRGEDLFVRTQDISDGEITDELPALEAPAGTEANRTRLEPGDVVVTITGVVGKAAVFRGRQRPAFVSQHVALVRPKPTDLNSDFLASYANLPLGEVPVLARFQYGQTKPGLGFRELAAAQLPLPPISLQRAFAARAGSLQALRRQCHKAAERLDILWRSILTSAFSGNLTEGWREAHMKELLEEMDQQSRALAEVR